MNALRCFAALSIKKRSNECRFLNINVTTAGKNLTFCINRHRILKKLFAQIANRKTIKNFFLRSAHQWEVRQVLTADHLVRTEAADLIPAADVLRVCAV